MLPTTQELIETFSLLPHPEGGYYKETYRAFGKTNTPNGERNHSTAIYYLLPQGARSKLHRIKSDELWHFYLGGPLQIVELSAQGKLTITNLGSNIKADEHLQHTVKAGQYFGALPKPNSPYAFVGCTVSPGFDFADFEIPTRQTLLSHFPSATPWIEALTDL